VTRAEIEAWLRSQDWQARFVAAQQDIREAIDKLRQERMVCREWLWEQMT
jgi:hypothetical protein